MLICQLIIILYATKYSLILSSIIKHDNILLIIGVPNRNNVNYCINIGEPIAMIIQRYSYIRKYLFIFSILFLLSGCDIMDEILGGGSDDSNSNQQNNNGSTILRVEVHFFIDDCTIIWTYNDGSNPVTAAHTSHGRSITSVSGTSTYSNDVYDTTFNDTFLGTAYSGTMEIMFFGGNSPSVSVDVDQTRKVSGTTKHITLSHAGVLYNNSASTDTMDEYEITGAHFTTTYVDASDDGSYVKTLQPGYVCGPNSYLKVQVYYQ